MLLRWARKIVGDSQGCVCYLAEMHLSTSIFRQINHVYVVFLLTFKKIRG